MLETPNSQMTEKSQLLVGLAINLIQTRLEKISSIKNSSCELSLNKKRGEDNLLFYRM